MFYCDPLDERTVVSHGAYLSFALAVYCEVLLTTHSLGFSKQSLLAQQVSNTSALAQLWINIAERAYFWTAGQARIELSGQHLHN